LDEGFSRKDFGAEARGDAELLEGEIEFSSIRGAGSGRLGGVRSDQCTKERQENFTHCA
jgi:hypothetical protein